jgi:uncharacterized alkaline shock family protein YloU
MNGPLKNIDIKEIQLPETVFIRDIESRVFQSIVVQCLSHIDGVALIEGNFIDSLLGRDTSESLKGIVVEQDPKTHSVSVRMEINVAYGVKIPQKAEEVQCRVVEELTRYTGLHVSLVHVVFKNLIPKKSEMQEPLRAPRPPFGVFAEDKINAFSGEI